MQLCLHCWKPPTIRYDPVECNVCNSSGYIKCNNDLLLAIVSLYGLDNIVTLSLNSDYDADTFIFEKMYRKRLS